MKEQLIIVGAGGHGKVCADIALKMKQWKTIAFLDDRENIKSTLGFKVIGHSKDAGLYIENSDIFVAIGNNGLREKIQDELEIQGASIPILIHPSAVLGEQVVIDKGTVIMAGAIINSDTVIGRGCIVNTGTMIDHDNIIGDFVHLSPGVTLAGTINIGKGTWLGIGSTVSNNIIICSGCIIGAGALVLKDITIPGTYIGVPVKRHG